MSFLQWCFWGVSPLSGGRSFLVWLLPAPVSLVIGVPLPMEGSASLLFPLMVNTHLCQIAGGRLPLLSACRPSNFYLLLLTWRDPFRKVSIQTAARSGERAEKNRRRKIIQSSQPKSGNNSKVPPADEWVNKMWCIHIMNSILS